MPVDEKPPTASIEAEAGSKHQVVTLCDALYQFLWSSNTVSLNLEFRIHNSRFDRLKTLTKQKFQAII